MTNSQEVQTQWVTRPDGRVAYDSRGSGPLVLMVPGMGDVRRTFRYVVPQLVDAGFRVITTDLRGHGDSDTSFAEYGDERTADDLAALLDEVGQPAVVVGNSMAGAAAAILAARRPGLVTGLGLLGPLLRDPHVPGAMRLLMKVLLAPAWVATTWKSYLPKLYAGTKPADFDAYRAEIVAALRRPGHAKAFSTLARTLTHQPAEAVLSQVDKPALVVVGEQDPDYADPRAEARWMADSLSAELLLVPDCGHYPQSQHPELVGPALIAFARRVTGAAADSAVAGEGAGA